MKLQWNTPYSFTRGYLSTNGMFYLATNSGRTFATKSEAMAYAKSLNMADLFVVGPRGGEYRVNNK